LQGIKLFIVANYPVDVRTYYKWLYDYINLNNRGYKYLIIEFHNRNIYLKPIKIDSNLSLAIAMVRVYRDFRRRTY